MRRAGQPFHLPLNELAPLLDRVLLPVQFARPRDQSQFLRFLIFQRVLRVARVDLQACEAFARLGDILDRTRPAMLSVENEEDSELFYTGTPEEYGAVLQAACEVAHARHIDCTNGGLVSSLVGLLTWEDILSRGEAAQACNFAWRAFAEPGQPVRPEVLCRAGSAADLPMAVREKIARGHALLEVYPGAGIDALNFHWYVADDKAMSQAVEFLRSQSDLPVLTNELGQHDEDPARPPALLSKALELDLSCVIWFSIDMVQARALIDPDGTLRPNGLAFQAFMAAHTGH